MTNIEQIRAALLAEGDETEKFRSALTALAALETEVVGLRAKVGECESAPTVATVVYSHKPHEIPQDRPSYHGKILQHGELPNLGAELIQRPQVTK